MQIDNKPLVWIPITMYEGKVVGIYVYLLIKKSTIKTEETVDTTVLRDIIQDRLDNRFKLIIPSHPNWLRTW